MSGKVLENSKLMTERTGQQTANSAKLLSCFFRRPGELQARLDL